MVLYKKGFGHACEVSTCLLRGKGAQQCCQSWFCCTGRVAEFASEVESASVLLISNQGMTTGLWSCSTCDNSRQRSGKQLHGFELQVMAKVHEVYLVL